MQTYTFRLNTIPNRTRRYHDGRVASSFQEIANEVIWDTVFDSPEGRHSAYRQIETDDTITLVFERGSISLATQAELQADLNRLAVGFA